MAITTRPILRTRTPCRTRITRIVLPQKIRVCLICEQIAYQSRLMRQIKRRLKDIYRVYTNLAPALLDQGIDGGCVYVFAEPGPSDGGGTLPFN